jgi:hypothetical protein
MSDTVSTPRPALGICLEEYEYPYPVRFLPLTNDLQPVAMAYMDIPPTAVPNGKAVVLIHGLPPLGPLRGTPVPRRATAVPRSLTQCPEENPCSRDTPFRCHRSLFAGRTILSGSGDELVELARENLR